MYTVSPLCVLKKIDIFPSFVQSQIKVGGLGLTGVARNSSEAHGSMVSGDLISKRGGILRRGIAQKEFAVLAVEILLADLRPALFEIYSGLPGFTAASYPKKISRLRLDCHTHLEGVPSKPRHFSSNNLEQLVLDPIIFARSVF